MNEENSSIESLKRLLITALLTSGTSMSGWNVQAHGNRSSHSVAEIRWGYEDYIIQRESYFNPNSADANHLKELASNIETLKRRQLSVNQDGAVFINRLSVIDKYIKKIDQSPTTTHGQDLLKGFNQETSTFTKASKWMDIVEKYKDKIANPDMATHAFQSDNATTNQDLAQQLQNQKQATASLIKVLTGNELILVDSVTSLVRKKELIEDQLILRPLTKNVLERIQANDPDGGQAIIESTGTPKQVIENYIWTQLDFQNWVSLGEGSTSNVLFANVQLTEHAISYAQKAISSTTDEYQKKDLQRALAALYNNLANIAAPDYTLPNKEVIPASIVQSGLDAALQSLKIYQELNDPLAVIRAKWMVGYQYLSNGNNTLAGSYFKQVIQESQKINNDNEKAWGLLYSALVTKKQDPTGAKHLYTEAKEIFTKLNDQTGLAVIAIQKV